MEREISSGAMLGIVLLALAAVIGLGFGVFAITKGVANEGTVNVQDSLGTVSTQVFLDYDQKIVTGNQITSGLKTFEGKAYAVLIATQSVQDGGKITPGHAAYTIPATIGTETVYFINYNAILARTNGAEVGLNQVAGGAEINTGAVSAATEALMTLKNGSFLNTTGFAAKSGNVVFDKETGGIYKTGNAEYVSSSSKFQAYLVKDASDNILGISAIQQ